jgi:hypothetical protein
MRLVNWNIEWMNHWFVPDPQTALRPDNSSEGITDTGALATRVASVIKSLDPDLLMVEEGPSMLDEMEVFVNTYLPDNSGQPLYDAIIDDNKGQQKLFALVKKNGALANCQKASDNLTQNLAAGWEVDIDGDFQLQQYEFTRMPLVVDGTIAANGDPIRVIGLHTKSKYVHFGESMWRNRRDEFVREAMKNRRRIAAEAMRTRQYVNSLMEANPQALVAVTGDFNDGPGMDYFEQHYLTHNVTDIILGSTFFPDRMFVHAFLGRVPANDLYSAIFDDYIDEIPNRKILLDHIVTSPALAPRITGSGIAHTEYEAATDANATGRQHLASDHRPVFVDVT